MNDNKSEATSDADCGKQDKLRTCQRGQKVLDWKAACWWPQGHKERECPNKQDETNHDCENTNADIKVDIQAAAADETTMVPVDQKKRANPKDDETLQCKTIETENIGNSGDDDDDGFIYESANFKTVRMRMEKGDTAFKTGKYDDAKKEYNSAWKHLNLIMSCGEHLNEDGDDDDVDGINDDDDDFEFGPSIETREKCLKVLSVVMAKLGECHAICKEWNHAIDHAKMAMDHDVTNQDALYLLAKSRYYSKSLLLALDNALFVHNARGRQLVKSIQTFLLNVINKKRALFQRIIDSYRLRVDDECVRVGDISELCKYSIYGLRAQGFVGDRAMPMKHFRAFLRMGCRNGVLPEFLLPENDMVKYQALIYMAATDDWFNIGVATEENRIQSFYLMTQQACNDNSTESLRSFAAEIAGPIIQGNAAGQDQQGIMDYISDDDEDDNDDDDESLQH